ncbi:hypothetical protein TRIP_C60139 [Candidatus Zixiibacteriota bacterium]|nr:hypothetical protein TRIP_C60139 [candidate division Zixibacteria bacterium]
MVFPTMVGFFIYIYLKKNGQVDSPTYPIVIFTLCGDSP